MKGLIDPIGFRYATQNRSIGRPENTRQSRIEVGERRSLVRKQRRIDNRGELGGANQIQYSVRSTIARDMYDGDDERKAEDK